MPTVSERNLLLCSPLSFTAGCLTAEASGLCGLVSCSALANASATERSDDCAHLDAPAQEILGAG